MLTPGPKNVTNNTLRTTVGRSQTFLSASSLESAIATRFPDQLWDSDDDDEDDNMDDLLRRRRRSIILGSAPRPTGIAHFDFAPRLKLIRPHQFPTCQIALRLWPQSERGYSLHLFRHLERAEHRTETIILPNPKSPAFKLSTSLFRIYEPYLHPDLMTTERLLTTVMILPSTKAVTFIRQIAGVHSRISAYPRAQAPTAKPCSIALLH